MSFEVRVRMEERLSYALVETMLDNWETLSIEKYSLFKLLTHADKCKLELETCFTKYDIAQRDDSFNVGLFENHANKL